VLCELIPGGVPDEITAGQAAGILEQVAPAGAVAQARCELAAKLLADIGHLDGQRREVKKKLAAAVTASGTSLTEIFGVGPVIAATVIGDVITVARFPSRDHFAAYNGTAPVEVPAGQRKIYRLSLRGTAVSTMPSIWPRSPRSGTSKHSDGRAYYQRKLAEGKTHKEALRCLKRRISDAIYARLRADARKAGPGGQPGNLSVSRAAGSHPEHRLFGQATPGPEPSPRAPATFTQATPAPEPSAKKIQRAT
jgi:transposase